MNCVLDVLEKPKLIFVRVDKIEPIDPVDTSMLEVLSAPVPALKAGEGLNHFAIELAAWLNPPLLYPQKNRTYGVQGNFRTVELCQSLPGDVKIPVLVTSKPVSGLSITDLSKLTICTNMITQGLDLPFAPQSLLQLVKVSNPDLLMELSPGFRTRSAMETWLGINRRLQLSDPRFATSPLGGQKSLL